MQHAVRGIRRRPLRSALTAVGVGIAIALLAVLLALAAGVSGSAERLALSSGVDLLAVSANSTYTATGYPPIPGAHHLPAAMNATDPNIASASPWLVADVVFANASLAAAVNSSPNGSAVPSGWGPSGSSAIGWIPSLNAGIQLPTLLSGPGFPVGQDRHWGNGTYTGPSTHAVVLDNPLASVLDVGAGDHIWASPLAPSGPSDLRSWFSNATAFTVVGVSSEYWLLPSAPLGFFYLSELQQLLAGPALAGDSASVVLIHLHTNADPGRDQTLLAGTLHGLTILTVSDILNEIDAGVGLYRTFGTLIGAVGLGVAFLFTTTVLLMSVDDRSREMALLRAVGFSPRWIALEISEEGVLLTGAGVAFGLPLGYLLSLLLNSFLTRLLPGLPSGFSFVAFDLGVVSTAILGAVTVGLAASVIPIVQALRLPIAQELRAP